MDEFQTIFQTSLTEHRTATEAFQKLEPQIKAVGDLLVNLVREHKQLFICGNGGSACDALHWSSEWRGRYEKDRRPLMATALVADAATLTCVGNDYGYENVFARQLEGLGRAGDLLIAISTSGNSPNVMRAVESARKMGITTVGLLGREGGKLAELVDQAITVPVPRTGRIQEMHELAMHILCEYVDNQINKLNLT